MEKNFFERMKEKFSKLPYEFSVTELHFCMKQTPCLDNYGDYKVRAKRNSSKNENVYDVIKVIGPYGLNVDSFTNIRIYLDKEDEEYYGRLWIPTNLYNDLNEEDEMFLLENFSLKRKEEIEYQISKLKKLL